MRVSLHPQTLPVLWPLPHPAAPRQCVGAQAAAPCPPLPHFSANSGKASAPIAKSPA